VGPSGHLDRRTKSPLFGEERTPCFDEYTPWLLRGGLRETFRLGDHQIGRDMLDRVTHAGQHDQPGVRQGRCEWMSGDTMVSRSPVMMTVGALISA